MAHQRKLPRVAHTHSSTARAVTWRGGPTGQPSITARTRYCLADSVGPTGRPPRARSLPFLLLLRGRHLRRALTGSAGRYNGPRAPSCANIAVHK
jgi:hypothetical protein